MPYVAAAGRYAGGMPYRRCGRWRTCALHEIARGRGQTLAQLASSWALRDRRVTSVLLGASSVAQLEQNVAALDRADFTPDELERIDEHAVDGGVNLWEPSSSA